MNVRISKTFKTFTKRLWFQCKTCFRLFMFFGLFILSELFVSVWDSWSQWKCQKQIKDTELDQTFRILHAGMTDTSAVTMLFTPMLDRAPLTRPQVKARYCTDKRVRLAQHHKHAERRSQSKYFTGGKGLVSAEMFRSFFHFSLQGIFSTNIKKQWMYNQNWKLETSSQVLLKEISFKTFSRSFSWIFLPSRV